MTETKSEEFKSREFIVYQSKFPGNLALPEKDTNPHIGVVVRDRSNGKIDFVHFEDGFPYEMTSLIRSNNIIEEVRKVQKEEALTLLKALSYQFEDNPELDKLHRAVTTRKKDYLDKLIEEIENFTLPRIFSLEQIEPNTGIYVVQGLHCGQGSFGLNNPYYQSLTCNPRISEKSLASLMRDLYPNGFGNIPQYFSHEDKSSLRIYRAFEIPEKAIDLVENPRRLKIEGE